jgi:predicted nucleotidyltransferase
MAAKKVLNISRKTADRIVSEVVERAKEINASPYPKFMHFVKKIAVFGSYLTDKEKLGDVDIAVLLERKEECERGNWEDDADECIRIHNKNVYNFFQVMSFPEKIVYQTLRNKSKSLSIHQYDELERMIKKWGTENKAVYQK